MKTLLLDCDGVLCDFVGGLIGAYNAEHGTALRPEDCDRWDIAAAYGLKWSDLNPIVHREGFCAGLSPLPGAIEAVHCLDRHYELFVVTAPFGRSKYWMHERTEWLLRTFGLCPKQVIHADDKRRVFGHALIDDRPSTIADWAACWPESLAILWDAPHNRAEKTPIRAHRVHNWGSLLAVFDSEPFRLGTRASEWEVTE